MKNQSVWAAAIVAVGFVAGCAILVIGARSVVREVADRFEASVAAHGQQVDQAGVNVGKPVQEGFAQLSQTFQRHAQAVEQAGDRIARAEVTIGGTIGLKQPVTVQGPMQDGALPVEAKIAK